MNSHVAVAAVLGIVGLVVGWRTAQTLVTGGYRIEEDEASRPAGRTWWPPLLLGGLWTSAALVIGDLGGWAALPAYLLFGWLTVALVWIDLDVHRLPDGLTLPAYPAVGALLLVASAATTWERAKLAVIGGVALWLAFWVLSILPGGGMGFGDVKFAGIVGALLGWLSGWHLVIGVMATFLVGGVVAIGLLLAGRVGLKGRIAFGPAMCAGLWVAVWWTPQALRSLAG